MDNKENEQNIVDSNNLENSIETTNTNMENTVLTTPQDNNTPQVVEVNNTKEVTKNVTNKEVIVEKNSKKKKEKKGHPIFLILLLIFLFAFVYFLPDITKFITDYQNDKNGVNELKSGTMTCTFNNSTNNIDYNYKFTFNYEKKRLKKSTRVTTNRLADAATDNKYLQEKEDACQFLKTVLDENDIGMSATCSVSAAVQVTTQNIDYKKLDLDFISDNIAEFEGFYPEYELNESVTTIENDLENSGYKCERIER